MFFKNKSKGQTSIEILAILGVLVIGGIILGTFYLQNINKKTAEATEISNIDYNSWIDDVNYPIPVCPNGIIEAPEQCEGLNMGLYTGLDCSSLGLGTGNLSCTGCSIDTSACSGAGSCGDGTVNQPWEQCDTDDFGGLSTDCSASNPLLTGTITCTNCLYDFTGCTSIGSTYIIIATDGDNCSVAPAGMTVVNDGDSVMYTISADSGYQIKTILIDGISYTPLTSIYTFTNVQANHTIHADCESIPGLTFTIKSDAGPDCSIDPSGITTVNQGNDQLYMMKPGPGYEIESILIDDVGIFPTESYTFINVQDDHTITVNCKHIGDKTYKITANSGVGGTLTPPGVTSVIEHDDITYTITADPGYEIDTVTIDGLEGGAISSYTFVDVIEDHTITATFKSVANYIIFASAGPNGSIFPSGAVSVPAGANQTFIFTPNSGYRVGVIKVNGSPIGVGGMTLTNSYTFYNVNRNNTIRVEFIANTPTNYTLTYTAGPNGSISGVTPQTVVSGGYGSTVTAVPNTGYQFVDWSDGVLDANRTDGPVVGNINVTANFMPGYSDPMQITVIPSNGNATLNGGFGVDVNTLANAPAVRYSLKVHIELKVGVIYTSTFNCRYNGGVRSSDINLGSNLSPQFKTYTPFDCNTVGTYRLTFTATNDFNSSNFASGSSTWVISPVPTVATPTANPSGGTKYNNLSVTLNTTTSGAKIYYRTNGSTPDCSGSQYSTPILITTTTTLKAKACKVGLNPSGIMTEVYTLKVATPTANPVSGTYDTSQSVVLNSSTTGAEIRYTIDGSTPLQPGSPIYSTPIPISTTTVLKAVGYKVGYSPSSIMTQNYVITNYCGDINTSVYTPNPPFSGYCDAPINVYTLASGDCSVSPAGGGVFDIIYDDPTLNGQVIKGPALGEPMHPEADLFCADHGYIYYDGTTEIVSGSGIPWYLRTACSASGPLGTNQWIAGSAPFITSRIYTQIICETP